MRPDLPSSASSLEVRASLHPASPFQFGKDRIHQCANATKKNPPYLILKRLDCLHNTVLLVVLDLFFSDGAVETIERKQNGSVALGNNPKLVNPVRSKAPYRTLIKKSVCLSTYCTFASNCIRTVGTVHT